MGKEHRSLSQKKKAFR